LAKSDIVEQRIRKARENRSTTLKLSSCRLREIPKAVFELFGLEELDLRDNRIEVVPERIRDLEKLKRLDLTVNPIQEVPDVAGLVLDWDAYLRCRSALSRENIAGIDVFTGEHQGEEKEVPKAALLLPELKSLPLLRELTVGVRWIRLKNPLGLQPPAGAVAQLIDSLGELQSLERLTVIGILLGEAPVGIRMLRGLRRLRLDGIGMKEAPDWLSDLTQLDFLDLSVNELERLPESLGTLPLTTLWALNNPFTRVPEVISRITPLTEVSLRSLRIPGCEGRIKQIPPEILQLPKLRTFEVDGQPIESPPPEVVKGGVEAIKNYWRQRQEAGIDYLCEAKLLIIGEAGAGKTSLAKKIQDRTYELRPAETSTEGIEIAHWKFPAAIRVKQDDREKLLQRDFQVHIWDFGGQEVYHATHQFFLTRRSVYALVADDRKEDTDFNYWLQVVELLGAGSPLVIVQNEKQDRRRDIDLGSLRARFANLKDAYRINLADNRGLDELVKALERELESLRHIGVALPATWKRVREALEKDPRNYIGVEEYLALCQQHGFTRREDKLQLSGYLHDLGICLHFQDDPVLKQSVILKPRWGTDAVYRVLDDPVVREHRGRFGLEDLARIWAENQYAAMRHELLRLMMRFQLCYELPAGEAYIAPQLLSPSQPSYSWDEIGNLVVRYEYEFMPKGLITRFIVALNHLIADQGLVWKNGVILERQDTRAEVVEDYPRRRISVRVVGTDSRGLLAIVDDQLERIHRSFSRLKYDRLLPCNCAVCRTRTDPYMFPLEELKAFAQDGDPIQCRTGRKLVDADELIRYVFPAWGRLGRGEFFMLDEAAPRAPESPKEVFVSYAWTDVSTAVVDQLQTAFEGSGITLVRDKNELKYKDSIREFMQRIGRGKCIVVVLSKAYLESKSCMFELTEIADRGDIRDRVFPIILEDADVYSGAGRLDYIKHWENQANELDSKMKTVGSANLGGIREEIDLFTKIRTTIAEIVNILGDMNTLTPEQHLGSNFEELIRAVEARLSE
jgi:GTPase SAR1 family protein